VSFWDVGERTAHADALVKKPLPFKSIFTLALQYGCNAWEGVMFEPIIYLIYAACGLTVFFGLLPLVVSIAYRGNPPPHIANMLERYVEVSVFGASSIFSPLRFIKRKEPDKIEPADKK
jgi:hypothetical protein